MPRPANFFRQYASGDLSNRFGAVNQLCSLLLGSVFSLGLTSLSGKAAKALEPLRPGSTLTISDEELSEQISEIQEQFDMTIARIRELG